VGGVYTGTITGGASNALVGQYFNTTGFTNATNNKAALHCLDWDHDHAAGRDHCGDTFGLRFERYPPARK
jgi:hypothetical protein